MGEKSRNMKNVEGIKLKKKTKKRKRKRNWKIFIGKWVLSFYLSNTYTEMNNGNYLFI